MGSDDRLARIVDALPLRAASRVLEIGCGHGVAATFVCERVTRGRYAGVDRSARMIAAAAKRNARFVDAGRASFHVMELEALDAAVLGARAFDVVLAVRVALFHEEPERARALVAPFLARGGVVRAVYDEPARR